MGYQLVAAALQPEWGRLLTTTERLVLVVMCQAAIDDGASGMPPRQYWGGTDLIIAQMQGEIPPKGSTQYKAARERVRAALRKLEKVGAIDRARVAVNGMRAEYRLLVNAPQLPVDNPPRPVVKRPPAPD